MFQILDRRELLSMSGVFSSTLTSLEDLNMLTRLVDALGTTTPELAPLPVIALNRMAFGPRPGDLDAFNALPGATVAEKFQVYVEQQLDPVSIDDGDCERRIAAAGFESLAKSLERLWVDYVSNNPYKGKDAFEAAKWRLRPAVDTRNATLLRAVYSRRQLKEVLADFWHNYFNVYAFDANTAPVFVHYDRDVIRAHAMGNFRQMLEAVTKSPAMFFYVARDGRDMLDVLAGQRDAALHVARKLCVRLIGDDPGDRVVNEAADMFVAKKDAADQLKCVTRTILLSEEFRTTWGSKVKRPFEVAIGMLRTLEIEFTTLPEAFFTLYNAMGQPLFAHATANGYADCKEAWTNSTSVLYRRKLCHALVQGEMGLGMNLADQMPATICTPNAIADFWTRRILGYSLPEASQDELVRCMAGDAGSIDALGGDEIVWRLPEMVELILASPDFQWR